VSNTHTDYEPEQRVIRRAEGGLRRICLVGVRGVGKTTLIRSVIGDLPGVDYVVGSAVLRELAGSDFARFDHLAPDVKQRYREDAIRWMEDRQARLGKHVLCDGHTSLLDESIGTVGQVFTEHDCRFFRELVLLEAPSEVVLEHRRNDTTKKRSLDLEVVRAEIAGERETSARVARDGGMTLHLLPSVGDPALRARVVELLRS
jgi:adenylate kinase